MSAETNTESEKESKPLKFLWAFLIILGGILFLVLSVKVPKDSVYERILSGIGEGLLILGLIDLILRGYLQRLANRLSPNETLLKFYQEANIILGAGVKRLEEINKEMDSISLRGDVKEILIELEFVSRKLGYIEDQVRTVEHILDPKTKALYEEALRKVEEAKKRQA